MGNRLRNPYVAAVAYFAVFFVIMLSYGLYEAALVDHEPFAFDVAKNLGVPAFTAVVGYVTTAFGRQ